MSDAMTFSPCVHGNWAPCRQCLGVVPREFEAKTFKAWGSLEGVPVDIVIRAFVEDGKVLAIRSVRVTDCDGAAYPRTNDGKLTRGGLDALAGESLTRDRR